MDYKELILYKRETLSIIWTIKICTWLIEFVILMNRYTTKRIQRTYFAIVISIIISSI